MDPIDGDDGPDTLQGTPGADLIRGFGGNDLLKGAAGNDTIEGGDGNDSLEGGRGDDWLKPGLGDDRIDGGDGVLDVIDYSDAPAAVKVNILGGPVNPTGGSGLDNIYNVEAVVGSTFNDTLEGPGRASVAFDVMIGYIYGGGGSDSISAGHSTVIDGGEANDSIVAYGGNYLIQGGDQGNRVWSKCLLTD